MPGLIPIEFGDIEDNITTSINLEPETFMAVATNSVVEIITLPRADHSATNRPYCFKRRGSAVMGVQALAFDLLDGVAGGIFSLSALNESIMIACDGVSNWHMVGRNP